MRSVSFHSGAERTPVMLNGRGVLASGLDPGLRGGIECVPRPRQNDRVRYQHP